MSKPRLYNTEAVVIKKSDLGEADSLVTLYTPYLGKIRAVAKGARRPKSRIGGHIEPPSHTQMLLARTRSLDIISQCQTVDGFVALRDDLRRTSSAIYVIELLDRFTAEAEQDSALFRLIVDTLHRLCWTSNQQTVLRHYELHLLGHLGYRPQLERCLVCQSLVEPGPNYFAASGGVVCPRCTDQEAAPYPLSLNALKVLRFLQRSDGSALDCLKVPPKLSRELETIMRRYIRYLSDKEVRSAGWLDSVTR